VAPSSESVASSNVQIPPKGTYMEVCDPGTCKAWERWLSGYASWTNSQD
jgi:hypothetical protein